MSCLVRIKEILPSLTKTELKLANYILANSKSIVNLSTQELAELAEVSTAAVVRFSYRLKYRGFPELKKALIMDNVNLAKYTDEDNFCLEEVYEKIISKKEKLTQSIIDRTYRLINPRELELIVNLLWEANRIQLLGSGKSESACAELNKKFCEIGKCSFFDSNEYYQKRNNIWLSEKDVCLIIDYSGEQELTLDLAKSAKEQGAVTIAISQINTSLDRLVDYTICVPVCNIEDKLGIHNYATTVIIDLIHIGVLKLRKEKL
ncbi:MAG: MurR/RpiR family transcriptional regulator [Anaerorhabdus sp.]